MNGGTLGRSWRRSRAGRAVWPLTLALLVGARRWHRHWGATDEEIARPLPGDDLIPDAKLHSTHAITIHAPAGRIWPWLAQTGYGGRAGLYSYDVLERRFGARNADRLNPGLPALTAGDTVPFYPGMPMTVALAEPAHFVMGRRQLLGLRQRAQAPSSGASLPQPA